MSSYDNDVFLIFTLILFTNIISLYFAYKRSNQMKPFFYWVFVNVLQCLYFTFKQNSLKIVF